MSASESRAVEHDDRPLEAARAQETHGFAPVHVGQADVHDDEIGRGVLDREAGGGGVGRLGYLEFGVQRQLLGQRLAQIGVVVDDEDLARLGHGIASLLSLGLLNIVLFARARRPVSPRIAVPVHLSVSIDPHNRLRWGAQPTERAMSAGDSEWFLAFNRFGLGARPGSRMLSGDPREGLLSELATPGGARLEGADLYEARDLESTTDLRAVLKGVLAEHLGLSADTLARAALADTLGVKPMSGLIAA